jgi:hypothetical protein
VAGGTIFQVRSPLEVGPVQDNKLEVLAERHNAHVILYGQMEHKEGKTIIYPKFYLHPAALPNATELSGRYELGSLSENDITQSGPWREYLRKKVISRTEVLAHFILGLRRLMGENYESAYSNFKQALDPEDEDGRDQEDVWEDAEGKRDPIPLPWEHGRQARRFERCRGLLQAGHGLLSTSTRDQPSLRS